MKHLEEEMTTAGIPGTGDSGEAYKPGPLVRRGKFAGHDTFVVAHETFNSLKAAKKSKKHWRKYLQEDDAYHDLREYARKKKGPIVVEDERTGACMFVRYGNGNMFEAMENNITTKFRRVLSDAGKSSNAVRRKTTNNFGRFETLSSLRGSRVHRTSHAGGNVEYHLEDPKTGKITHSVNGQERKGVLTIDGASSTGGSDIKMHHFYHHLLKHHIRGLVGTRHSEGAKRVWQNLAKKIGNKGSVSGWYRGKPVNLDPSNEDETHAPENPRNMRHNAIDTREPEEKEIADTKLIATIADKHRSPSESPSKKVVRKKKIVGKKKPV